MEIIPDAAMLDALPLAVVIYDAETRAVHRNARAEEWLRGVPAEEMPALADPQTERPVARPTCRRVGLTGPPA